MRYRIFLFTFLTVFILRAGAQTPNVSDLFKEGLQQYQAKEFSKAEDSFKKCLDQDPGNASVLTNLALTTYQLDKKPLAIGLLRKALAENPRHYVANSALKFVLSQFQIKEIPRQLETYDSLRKSLLEPISIEIYLLLSLLSLFVGGWLILSFAAKRKKAVSEERTLPQFPILGAILCLSFVIFTTLLTLKAYDETLVRATIVEEKVNLQTAPGDNQVNILELYGGMEVVVKKIQDDWAQINYPGSLTGWIKKSSLVMTR